MRKKKMKPFSPILERLEYGEFERYFAPEFFKQKEGADTPNLQDSQETAFHIEDFKEALDTVEKVKKFYSAEALQKSLQQFLEKLSDLLVIELSRSLPEIGKGERGDIFTDYENEILSGAVYAIFTDRDSKETSLQIETLVEFTFKDISFDVGFIENNTRNSLFVKTYKKGTTPEIAKDLARDIVKEILE